ncbi:MAG TPA: glycosyltransferase family 39 protein, partial [Gaiellaceae bacterium]|nr:glycosyltransferase family 39 protein [Gaiellaceae bacterium]
MSLPLPFPARRSTALIELTDALVVFAVAAGVGLRIWILVSSPGTVDGDEGVWGLMIRHVLDGEWPAFYWGQAYGGTQEVFLSAPVVALFGLSPITIRIAPIGLWAVASVLVWRVGRRTIGEPQARLAAGLFWLWPTYFLWKSTRAHGFYGSTLVLGLVVLLLVLRLRERPSRRDLVLLGLALGCGWWASPQIAIVAL